MIDIHNSILVVVDFQGKLAQIVHNAEETLKNAAILIQGMKVLDIPVIATEQYPKGLGHTVAAIADHFDGVPVLEKGTFSCCGDTAFMERLKTEGRQHVILCGIETHVCVYQTAQDLINNGYAVHLVTDAVSSRKEENRNLGIHKIESLGAKLTSTEMALFELLKISGTDQFKTISKLVR
jgi:nicotinamidase-related amidase